MLLIFLKFINLFVSVYFLFLLLFFFIIIIFINIFLLQEDMYLNYIKNFGYFWTELFIYININNLYTSKFFLFFILLLLSSIIFCIIKNYNNKKNFISYLLIHIGILLLLFNFFLKNYLFNFIKYIKFIIYNKFIINENFIPIFKNYNKFFSYIWIPQNWSVNKIIIKEKYNFLLFNIPIYFNLNKFFIYYNRYKNFKLYFSKIFIKKNQNFLKFSLKINKPKFYSNLLLYQSSFNELNSNLKIILYYINNNIFKKVFIKTYTTDLIPLNIFNFNLNNLILEIKFFKKNKFFFIFNQNFIKNKYLKFFLKKIYFIKFFLRKKELINLGLFIKYKIYNFMTYKSVIFNSYVFPYKEKNFYYNLLSFKNNNDDIFIKIPLINKNNIEDFLRIIFILYNKFCKIFILNGLFKNLNNKIISKKFKFKYIKLLNYLILNLNKNLKFKNNYFILNILSDLWKLSKKNYNKINFRKNDFEILFLKNNFKYLINMNYLFKNLIYLKVIFIKKKYSSLLLLKKSKNQILLFLSIFIFLLGLLVKFFIKFNIN